MWRTAGLATFLSIAAAAGADAQDAGDPVAGRAFAQQVCAVCHAVRAGQTQSPNPDAPTFQKVVQTPGITALALTVILQSAHRRMPDLVLSTAERNDVIAYMLSLRPAQ
jgi:mono/diheme cytochrome c family protein